MESIVITKKGKEVQEEEKSATQGMDKNGMNERLCKHAGARWCIQERGFGLTRISGYSGSYAALSPNILSVSLLRSPEPG